MTLCSDAVMGDLREREFYLGSFAASYLVSLALYRDGKQIKATAYLYTCCIPVSSEWDSVVEGLEHNSPNV